MSGREFGAKSSQNWDLDVPLTAGLNLESSKWSVRAAVEKRQTRDAQNVVPERACGFESHPPHYSKVTRSAEEVGRVHELDAVGLSRRRIARITGIPRTTVSHWLNDHPPAPARRYFMCGASKGPFPRLVDQAYAYLLGLYLGDGCLLKTHRNGVLRLNITLDQRYPGIIEEATAATKLVMPTNKATATHHPVHRYVWVNSYSKHWPCLFPQHGPGMKHERTIELDVWQREICGRYPWRFLRGLIHSDGGRSMNRIKHPKRTYEYPRYQFSNRSDDIRDLFCEYCDRVGVEWRRMNRWNISVARRGSVALMDSHIGPKR
jgi:hypothetical protein